MGVVDQARQLAEIHAVQRGTRRQRNQRHGRAGAFQRHALPCRALRHRAPVRRAIRWWRRARYRLAEKSCATRSANRSSSTPLVSGMQSQTAGAEHRRRVEHPSGRSSGSPPRTRPSACPGTGTPPATLVRSSSSVRIFLAALLPPVARDAPAVAACDVGRRESPSATRRCDLLTSPRRTSRLVGERSHRGCSVRASRPRAATGPRAERLRGEAVAPCDSRVDLAGAASQRDRRAGRSTRRAHGCGRAVDGWVSA